MLRVLIIEDDFILAEEWKQALIKTKDYSVNLVKTGSEALDSIDIEMPDIIIVDLFHKNVYGSLNSDNGIRIMGPLKRSNPKLKMIAVTAYNNNKRAVGTETVVFNLGADYFLSKPFDTSQLLEKVQEAKASIDLE